MKAMNFIWNDCNVGLKMLMKHDINLEMKVPETQELKFFYIEKHCFTVNKNNGQ